MGACHGTRQEKTGTGSCIGAGKTSQRDRHGDTCGTIDHDDGIKTSLEKLDGVFQREEKDCAYEAYSHFDGITKTAPFQWQITLSTLNSDTTG